MMRMDAENAEQLSLNKDFRKALMDDWLSWIGQPMLYDGGLCVNRTIEEHTESNKYIHVRLSV